MEPRDHMLPRPPGRRFWWMVGAAVAFYEENGLSCDDWTAAQAGGLTRQEFTYEVLSVEVDGDRATLRAEERYRPSDPVTGERASEPETFLEIHRWVRYDGSWRFVEYFPD